ncbi:hypothetical protein XBI1_1950015 [Xenorhabdus bovienii str. Intermedium]|uniref:Uncharacterized protein n=1 Tax=Xenorhabdus bovienii str. Intermedium TaxID=1379677 RepID=A0A077QH41_XENBV|nr:hypothetical protein XBI1_1950015 [Xenorhabdus bovienii str. Intermedium]
MMMQQKPESRFVVKIMVNLIQSNRVTKDYYDLFRMMAENELPPQSK